MSKSDIKNSVVGKHGRVIDLTDRREWLPIEARDIGDPRLWVNLEDTIAGGCDICRAICRLRGEGPDGVGMAVMSTRKQIHAWGRIHFNPPGHLSICSDCYTRHTDNTLLGG